MNYGQIACNLNDMVKVRLTDRGREILTAYHGGVIPKYLDRNIVGGWLNIQLWELASIFGPYLYNGNPSPPIEMNIMVCLDKE